MPTNHDEPLQQRYQRERDDYLKALAKYTPEQIATVEVDLNNAAATIAQLRAVLRGLVDDIQGLIAESDGVAGLHRNGDVAPWGELEAGGQFERLSHLPAAIEAAQCSEVGRKCSEQCAELPAQPVPRDVLMAAMTEVRRTQMKIVREGLQGGRWAEDIDDAVSQVDLAAIADRYARQLQPNLYTDKTVIVEVSGLTGVGKSGVAGEIEIAMKAIGLEVEWINGDEEKYLTHSDFIGALEMYRPKVVIVERNIPRAAQEGAVA